LKKSSDDDDDDDDLAGHGLVLWTLYVSLTPEAESVTWGGGGGQALPLPRRSDAFEAAETSNLVET